ncbi:MAG: hypothetical protein WD669_04110 [Pirellulales bacterium]
MHTRDDNKKIRRGRTGKRPTNEQPAVKTVPQIYEVVIACRHEAEQRAVFERMRGEGFRCRVMTL